jgi:hypothetical protein
VVPIQLYDPARITPAQRRTEAAALLALGLHRLRGGDAHNGADGAPSPVDLGFGGQPRVHANPAHRSPQT